MTNIVLLAIEVSRQCGMLVDALRNLSYTVDVAPPLATPADRQGTRRIAYLGAGAWPEPALESAIASDLLALERQAFEWVGARAERVGEFLTWPCCTNELALRLQRNGFRKVRARDLAERAAIRERAAELGLIGGSRPFIDALVTLRQFAQSDAAVLIQGETGTGKESAARAVHAFSARAKGAFEAVNCGALPETLIENELFGAERGAHSTATRKVTGKVAAAEGGTLFLDEIGELSAAAQAKLLQLLETREYHPLGGTTSIRADVRILSATNADLEQRVAQKKFRGDLYYRLHVVPLEVPGLEDRREDIPELVEHFSAEASERHKLARLPVSRRALVACREASWPGHTRQLAHAVEAAVIRAHGERATTLQAHHVFPKLARDEDAPLSLHEATRTFQRRHLLDALERHDWNVTEAARELDLARTHLHKLINDYDLRRGDEEGGNPQTKKRDG
jgi:Nif-specific regulatory protein